jgi:FdhD protein
LFGPANEEPGPSAASDTAAIRRSPRPLARDTGPRDAGPRDAGPRDAGPRDAGPRDAGPRDTGPRDAGLRDAGLRDTGPRDAGPRDAGPRDAGPRDAGLRDAGPRDAGLRDAGLRERSVPGGGVRLRSTPSCVVGLPAGYAGLVKGPIEERPVVRVGLAGAAARPAGELGLLDPVVVEAPLELRDADGKSLTVTMRTPGDPAASGDDARDTDLDLARGLLYTEGVLRDAAEAGSVRRAPPESLAREERGNVVVVHLDPALIAGRWPTRTLPASAGCGVCGKASIAALELRADAVRSDLAVAAEIIAGLPDRLRAGQAVFASTGGLHAAGAFTAAGELLAVREDVGRHNAVDKLVGWALRVGRLPLGDAVLCVSGRLGYEIAHKAVMAGFPIIVSVSAPSSLAVDVAERFRVTVCGFTRGGRFNVYSHAARIAGPAEPAAAARPPA